MALQSPLPPTLFFLDLAVFLEKYESKHMKAFKKRLITAKRGAAEKDSVKYTKKIAKNVVGIFHYLERTYSFVASRNMAICRFM